MFQTSTLSSTDFTDYNWPEAELNCFHAYMTSDAPLWQPPPDRADREARKAYWTGEIRRWIATRSARPDAYMSAQELGAAEDRAFILLRALLDNVAAYYRQHPRTKVALGVLVHDTIFSDNSQGCCTVSAVRVGKFLGCDEKYVRRARELLANEHLMGREKHNGLSDRHWPIFNREFAGESLHPTWWLDATSEVPARRGRPKKPRTLDVRPLPEKPWTSNVRPFEKTPDTTSENSGHLTSDEFSTEFTKEKETGPSARVEQKTARPNGVSMQVDDALAVYNEAARQHGFLECRPTAPRLRRVAERLQEIGGIEAFKRAVSAIPRDDFLMGRVRPKDGRASFKLDLDALLQTHQGDRLARLLDVADASNATAGKSADDEVRELAAGDTGRRLIDKLGEEVGMQKLREIVIEKRRAQGRD